MVYKMQFQKQQFNGEPLLRFEESQTIQQDVPTLREILARYATTGEIIGTQKQQFFDENSYQDCNCIVPDVEDMNIAFQNIQDAKARDEFLQKTQQEPRQHNDIEDGGVVKTSVNAAALPEEQEQQL